MRLGILGFVAVSFLAAPPTAGAQALDQDGTPQGTATPPAASPAAAPAPAPATTTSSVTFDLGGRGTTFTGDSARFNEFRDLSNGLYLDDFGTSIQHANWFIDFGGTHAGRRDASYTGEATLPGRLKVFGSFADAPWLISDTTKTVYEGAGTSVLTIPGYVQSMLQSNAAQITNVVANATPLTISSQRKYSKGGLEYMPDADTTISFHVNRMDRSGDIVGAGTFGFSAADELPVPVNQHQTDVDAGVERVAGLWLFRVGYTSSWYRNDNQSLTWDDPYQATDKTTLSSTGQMALSPDSFMQSLDGSASVRLPRRTRLTGTVSIGSLTDNTTLLPETTNTTVPTFTLDRTTAEGDGRTTSGNVIFTSHPTRLVDVDVRYRYYDYDDRTPVATQVGGRIEYDSTVEIAPLSSPNSTVPFGLKTQTLDAGTTVTLGPADVGAAYSRNDSDYTFRIFSGSTTQAGRVTVDTTGLSWLSLHGRYEHSERRGANLDTTDLVAIGEQPTLQTFDIADLNEDVGTVTASILFGGSVSLNASAGGGRDVYPVNALSTGFGLANAAYTTYSVGIAAAPGDNVSFSLSYDRNGYTSLQDSRSANPGVQFTDPTRNWSADGNDITHSVTGDLTVKHLVGRVSLHATVDFNKGSTLYLYGLAPASTLPAVSQLPQVMSELRRATVDLGYPLTARATVGVGYWYEQFLVADFAQGATALAPIAIPSLLTLDNALLPYTAQTVFVHVTYHW